MKILTRIGAFLAIFLLALLWRFPYDTLVEQSVRRAETATGATIIYDPVSAGPLGVKVNNLQISMPSGASIRFDSARIFPTREGLRATGYQKDNEMKATVSPTTLVFSLTNIEVETGSEGIGKATATGQLTYGLSSREGKGELRLVIPELKLPLPVDPSIEIGSAYTIRKVGTPRKFVRYGECGMEMSDLLPRIGACADDICLIRSMHTDQFNHLPGQLMMNCGSPVAGRPSLGSWLAYGVGSENRDLPAFVSLVTVGRGIPGGSASWSSGFLPSTYAGTQFQSVGDPVLNLGNPPSIDGGAQAARPGSLASR